MSDLPVGRTRWLIALIFLISTFNFADRTVFAVLGQAIKVDLGLTDLQLGLLNGAGFALVYALVGLPFARWAERGSRVLILSLAVGLWSLMTSLGGVARNYWTVLVSRVGVGIGEAGFLPPVTSLISDVFPAGRRASVMAFIGVGGAVGPWLGASLGGYLAEAHSWRTAFLLVGLPGVVLAPLFALTVREPQRGAADPALQSREEAPRLAAVVAALWSKHSFRHLALAGAIASVSNTAISLFLHAWLVRVHHVGQARAGYLFGILALIGIGLGSLLGGFGADRAARRDPRYLAWIPALGLLVAGPAYGIAFTRGAVEVAVPWLALGGLLVFLNYGPTLAMTQNLVEPRMRATAYYVYGLVGTLLGFVVGPAVLGEVSDRLAVAAYGAGNYLLQCPGGVAPPGALPAEATRCAAASASGLRQAMIYVGLLYMWAAVHYLLASRRLRQESYGAAAAAPSG